MSICSCFEFSEAEAHATRLVQVSRSIVLLTSTYLGHVKHTSTSRVFGESHQAVCGNVRVLCHVWASTLGVGLTHNLHSFIRPPSGTCICIRCFITHSLTSLPSPHSLRTSHEIPPHMPCGTCPHNTVCYGRWVHMCGACMCL